MKCKTSTISNVIILHFIGNLMMCYHLLRTNVWNSFLITINENISLKQTGFIQVSQFQICLSITSVWEGPFSPDWSRIISVISCAQSIKQWEKLSNIYPYDMTSHVITMPTSTRLSHSWNLRRLSCHNEVERSEEARSSPSSCTKNDLRACKARVDVRGRRVTGQTNQ